MCLAERNVSMLDDIYAEFSPKSARAGSEAWSVFNICCLCVVHLALDSSGPTSKQSKIVSTVVDWTGRYMNGSGHALAMSTIWLFQNDVACELLDLGSWVRSSFSTRRDVVQLKRTTCLLVEQVDMSLNE